jgi:hypothetical protein
VRKKLAIKKKKKRIFGETDYINKVTIKGPSRLYPSAVV